MRATAIEGSFGTKKKHYGLRKIAARIKSKEIMLIFFGIHTANVVNLARREAPSLVLLLNVPHVECDFTGVVAPDVTEKLIICFETRTEV